MLLLDEPTAGSDVVAKTELMDLVADAVAAGGSVVMVSSELDELVGFCDHIYVMRDGSATHLVDGDLAVAGLAALCGESAAAH